MNDFGELLGGLFGLIVCTGVPIILILALVYLVNATKKEEAQVKLEIQQLLSALPRESQAAFMIAYNSQQKKPTTAVVLTLLLGGIGAHKFYMGQTGLGILYLLFSWTFIPGIVAFIEAFTISKSVHTMNRKIAREQAAMLSGNPAAFLT